MAVNVDILTVYYWKMSDWPYASCETGFFVLCFTFKDCHLSKGNTLANKGLVNY